MNTALIPNPDAADGQPVNVAPTSASATQVIWHELAFTFTNAGFTVFDGTAQLWVQKAIIFASATNPVNVLIGAALGTSGWRVLSPSDEYFIEAPVGCAFNLNSWYGKSASAGTTTIQVLYC